MYTNAIAVHVVASTKKNAYVHEVTEDQNHRGERLADGQAHGLVRGKAGAQDAHDKTILVTNQIM